MKMNVHVHEARYDRRSLCVEDGQVGDRDVWRNVDDAAPDHDDGQTATSRCPRPVNEARVTHEQVSSLRDQGLSSAGPRTPGC